ncbi:MAG: dihydroorotate dehydrogenase-like protein [Bacteroidales bacterium]|nr:dihydroorotate dehydrogenase-like protein [Bacteroidales bacterium]MDD2323250.1 dihydroorotate dehydrogenase-like protein [Bacteroidales bacterium]MDD3010454.1 dihydroorotate dehydrogenase-like protein [Bacteroidales bacterium]MDD3961857.1 dihydroorotate dehydrogenase-like protein [Bacteroidales bacterium]MDY0286006.1 dihydroorotate dehydrogenase-like protein [Bacteroidales bacterium]
MSDLSTNYMGIPLENPIVIGANGLTKNIKFLKKLEQAGAAAVVYKSLFEEQITYERIQLAEQLQEYAERNAEMGQLYPTLEHAGTNEHIHELKYVLKNTRLPIIASLNALEDDTWVEYAKKMAETGVKGLELNFYEAPVDFEKNETDILLCQLETLKKVKQAVNIPISVKISPFYGNLLRSIKLFSDHGADAIVLFNRLFQPDIDIDKIALSAPNLFSAGNEYRLPLRFAGLLYKKIDAQIVANSGIYEGEDVVKLLLAGANAVQVVSALYMHGAGQITTMLEDMKYWMEHNNFSKIDDFRGKLSKANIKDPFAYKRAQYVDILLNSDEIIKTKTMI